MMKIAVIIAAAGSGQRYAQALAQEGLGSDRSKIDEDLGGRPVLQRTVELFNKHADVGFIVVAGPADPAASASFRARHADKLAILGVKICEGGLDHRYQTVQRALAHIPPDCSHVAVHDAARPCTSPALIDRVFAAAAKHPAVIPGVDVPDTLKRVDPAWVMDTSDDPVAAILGAQADRPLGRRVERTVDRTHLVSVQTPQVFDAGLLRRAYQQADLSSTDDAELVERLGQPVLVVPGEPTNIKITRPADLTLARAILGVRGPEGRPTHLKF